MTININNLKDLTPDQLRETAGKLGLQVHWKAKPETIIKQIADKAFAPTMPKAAEDAEFVGMPLPNKPAVYTTQDELEKSLAKVKEAVPAFETIYSEPDDTGENRVVTYRCKGAEECLNLSTPLRILLNKANHIKRGRVAPIGHESSQFDSQWNPVSGKNAYTNSVLAG